MNTRLACLLVVALLVLSGLSAEECARCRLAAGWGLATKPANSFDATSVATLKGEIISVEDVATATDVIPGLYILLRVDQEQIPVRLASSEYLKAQGITLHPYDVIEVTGSKVPFLGRTGLFATKITASGLTVQLRDAQGKDTWH